MIIIVISMTTNFIAAFQGLFLQAAHSHSFQLLSVLLFWVENVKNGLRTMPNKYRLFTSREVCIGKNCARGLGYRPRPQAEAGTQDRGHSFSQYGPTSAG